MEGYNYAAQVARLRSHPENIPAEWLAGEGLFQFVSVDGKTERKQAGCLTMIRAYPALYRAQDMPFVDEIAKDERLPDDSSEIKIKHLAVFQEWQERLDRELRGLEPFGAEESLPVPKNEPRSPLRKVERMALTELCQFPELGAEGFEGALDLACLA
jgi:hypothetical protein